MRFGYRILDRLVLVGVALCIVATAGTCRASDRFLVTDADGFSSGSIRDIALSADGNGWQQPEKNRFECGT
jgi:hypothetical protein